MFKDLKSLLTNHKFLYIWFSQIFSQLTINIMNFVLLIKLFKETQSSIAASLMWISYALPAIFAGPIAAAFIDIVDRRKALMVTNLLQSITIFIYIFFYKLTFFLVYAVTFTYSFLNQFYVPAEASTIPFVVRRRDLPLANGLFLITQQLALIIGFGFAGVFMRVFGFERILLIGVVMLFLGFVSVSFLPSMGVKTLHYFTFEKALIDFFKKIITGYKFIKEKRLVNLPFFLLIGAQVSLVIVMVIAPSIAKDIFEIDVEDAGLLMVVPACLGAGVGAVIIPRTLKDGTRKIEVVERFLFITPLAGIFLSLITPKFIIPLRMVFGVIILGLLGLSFVGITIPAQTLLQENTPDKLRGRVFGNIWFLVTVATVIPTLLASTLTEILGVRFFLFSLSLVLFLVFILSKTKGRVYIQGETL